MLHDIVDKTAQRIETDLKDQPEVQADFGLVLSNVYFQLQGPPGDGGNGSQDAWDSAEPLGGRKHTSRRRTKPSRRRLDGPARIDEAELAARQTIALQRKLRGKDSIEEAGGRPRCLGAVLRHMAYPSRTPPNGRTSKRVGGLLSASMEILKNKYGENHEES